MEQSFKVASKKTGATFLAVPVVVGFMRKRQDMFRLYRDNGTFVSVKRGSIERRYNRV